MLINHKRIILGLVLLGLMGAAPLVARQREEARRSTMSSRLRTPQIFGPNTQSPQWKSHARLFDKNKLSATAIFAGATRVESFRLAAQHGEKAQGKIAGFGTFGRGTTEGHRFATRVGAIVLDARNYAMPGTSIKACYFEPGVAFRVWKQKEFVDVVICFKCKQLAVVENDPKVPMNSLGSIMKGRFRVAGDFDVARPQLLELAKEAFPGDAVVQGIR